jgi:yecA family protein
MMELASIEQVNAWLDRLRTDGRNFDYVHGFMTGIVCAFSAQEAEETDIGLLSLLDDPDHAVLPDGIDTDEILECLSALFDDIEGELVEGTFRPYMGGRYVNRIRPDSSCESWCRGFVHSCLAFAEEVKDDESLATLLIPVLILADPEDPSGVIGELPPEERPTAAQRARDELIRSVYSIYAMLDKN